MFRQLKQLGFEGFDAMEESHCCEVAQEQCWIVALQFQAAS